MGAGGRGGGAGAAWTAGLARPQPGQEERRGLTLDGRRASKRRRGGFKWRQRHGECRGRGQRLVGAACWFGRADWAAGGCRCSLAAARQRCSPAGPRSVAASVPMGMLSGSPARLLALASVAACRSLGRPASAPGCVGHRAGALSDGEGGGSERRDVDPPPTRRLGCRWPAPRGYRGVAR